MKAAAKNQRQAGVSLPETLVVLGIVSVLASVVVPVSQNITQGCALSGDTRSVGAALNLARMRAASDFTHARLYTDLSGSTFHVELWNKAGNCWQTYNDIAANTCTKTTSPVTALAAGDSFGFGSISTGPTADTSTVAQPATCQTGSVGNPDGGTAIANTSCIEFNSRGFPVDNTGAVVASDAIYVQNSVKNLFSAVTVPVAGLPAMYSYSGASTWASY